MGTIAEKIAYIIGTKEAIRDAILEKGGGLEEQATFRSYADAISGIPTGSQEDPDVHWAPIPAESLIHGLADDAQPDALPFKWVFETPDSVIIVKNGESSSGGGTTSAGTAGTVTRIWRSGGEVHADVIAFSDTTAGFWQRNFLFTKFWKTKNGILFSSDSNRNYGIFFYNFADHTFKQIGSYFYCAMDNATEIKDPDGVDRGSVIFWGSGVSGCVKFDAMTNTIEHYYTTSSVGTSAAATCFTHHAEFGGLHVFTGNAKIPAIYNELTGEFTRHTEACNLESPTDFLDVAEGVRFFFSTRTYASSPYQTGKFVIDIREPLDPVVSFEISASSLFFGPKERLIVHETDHHWLITSNAPTSADLGKYSQFFGIRIYGKTSKQLSMVLSDFSAFTTSFRFNPIRDVLVLAPSGFTSNSSSLVIFNDDPDWTPVPVAEVRAHNACGIDTFIVNPENAYRLIMFVSADAPVKDPTHSSGFWVYDQNADTVINAASNIAINYASGTSSTNGFMGHSWRVRPNAHSYPGMLVWAKSHTNYLGVYYFGFLSDDFMRVLDYGGSWETVEAGYYPGTVGAMLFATQYSANLDTTGGVMVWDDSVMGFSRAFMHASYGWKICSTGWPELDGAVWIFTNTVSSSNEGCYLWYKFNTSQVISSGYNYTVVKPFTVSDHSRLCKCAFISSVNSQSTGLWSIAFDDPDNMESYFADHSYDVTSGYNWDQVAQGGDGWGCIASSVSNNYGVYKWVENYNYWLDNHILEKSVNNSWSTSLHVIRTGLPDNLVMSSSNYNSSNYHGVYLIEQNSGQNLSPALNRTSNPRTYGYKWMLDFDGPDGPFQLLTSSSSGCLTFVYKNGFVDVIQENNNSLSAQNISKKFEFQNNSGHTFSLCYNDTSTNTGGTFGPFLMSHETGRCRAVTEMTAKIDPRILRQFPEAVLIAFTTHPYDNASSTESVVLLDYSQFKGAPSDIKVIVVSDNVEKSPDGSIVWIWELDPDNPDAPALFATKHWGSKIFAVSPSIGACGSWTMGQLDKIEIRENAIGDLAITCPGGGSHTLLKYDSDEKAFRDVLGNTTETVRTATSAWGIVKDPDWEYTFGPDSGNGTFNGDGTGMVMNTAKLDVFPIDDKNFKEANLKMQTGLIDDPEAYTQLPGLDNSVLIGGRYRVALFSPIWQSMEILERPRGDGAGQTKNFFCPNSRIRSLDFSENNGFALIYDGIGSAPVIKYPDMEKVNTRIEDEREYGDEIPGDYSKNRNEFTITSSAVFNHFREICTFLDSPVDASKIYTTETESKDQFTLLLPRPYTQICVLKSQAHSKKP